MSARVKSPSTPRKKTTRPRRDLSDAEIKVQLWVKSHFGILSRVARETGYQPQFVHRIAYNRPEAKSKGLVIERALKALGCPLIQKIR